MSAAVFSPADDPLRYPIGRFAQPSNNSSAERSAWIGAIEELPAHLRQAVQGLSDAKLDTPYRPHGWTVRQLVHHLADSHMNSYVRFRLALTEETPVIKPYDENTWAALPDARSAPVELSLTLLDALHARWVYLLRSLTDDQWQRVFRHPERGESSLVNTLALYAWHGQHHVAHILNLRERTNW